MNLYLDNIPTELASKLKHPNSKGEVTPVMHVPDFRGNLQALFALISEMFLFCKRRSNFSTEFFDNVRYKVVMDLNPLEFWKKEIPNFDIDKFNWFNYWRTIPEQKMLDDRKVLIELLHDNGLIFVKENFKHMYEINFLSYPQFEALSLVQESILEVMDHANVDLYSNIVSGGIRGPSLSYFVQKGLAKVGFNLYWVDFTFGGEVVLNDKHLISKLNYNSVNDRFFEYVSQYPKKEIKRSELESVIGKIEKPISKIVYDIGFSGELKKLFFPKVSNNAVYFNSPVTRDDLLGIDFNKEIFLKEVKELKKYPL